MLSFLMAKPPVPAVPKVVVSASNSGSLPASRNSTCRMVMPR